MPARALARMLTLPTADQAREIHAHECAYRLASVVYDSAHHPPIHCPQHDAIVNDSDGNVDVLPKLNSIAQLEIKAAVTCWRQWDALGIGIWFSTYGVLPVITSHLQRLALVLFGVGRGDEASAHLSSTHLSETDGLVGGGGITAGNSVIRDVCIEL